MGNEKISLSNRCPRSLRQRVEELVDASRHEFLLTDAQDVQALVDELHVQKIQLEMQNEELRQTQVELSASLDEFVDLYEFAPVGYLTLDPNATITAANMTLASMLGVERANLIGKTLWDFVVDECKDTVRVHLQNVCTSALPESDELTIRSSDGKELFVRFDTRRERNGSGTPSKYRTTIVDLTEQRRASNSLRDSECQLQAIFDNAFQFIALLSPDGTLLRVNQSALELIGKSESEVCGQYFWDSPWWEHSPDFRKRLKMAVQCAGVGFMDRFDASHRDLDGELIDVDVTLSPVTDARGKVVLLLSECRDFTDRDSWLRCLGELNSDLERRVEERTAELARANHVLSRQEWQLRNLLDSVDVTISEWDIATMKPIFVSQRAEEIFGYPLSDWSSVPDFWANTILHPDDREQAVAFRRQETNARRDHDLEYRAIDASGRIIWIHESVNVRSSHRGDPITIGCVMIDITERKTAEDERDRFFESSNVFLCVGDLDGTFRRVNQTFTKALGYSKEQLHGTQSLGLVHPDDIDRSTQALQQAVEGASFVEFVNRIRCRNGIYRWLAWTCPPPLPGETALYLVGRDVTEELGAIEALHESMERFDLAVEGLASGVWDWRDVSKDEQWWSPRFFELLGYEPGEIDSRHSVFRELVHPDDLERAIEKQGFATPDQMLCDAEQRLRTKSGEYHWFRSRAAIRRDETGQILRMTGCLEDIHERKTAEERLARSLESLSRSETLFRAAFENAAVGMCLLDLDGNYRSVNATFCELVGYAGMELLKKNEMDITHPDDLDADENLKRKFWTASGIVDGGHEKRFIHKNGSVVWAHVCNSVVQDQMETSRLRVAHVQDISKRIEAEATTRREQEFVRRLVDTAQSIVLVLDTVGRVVQFNSYLEGLTGWSAQQATGIDWFDTFLNESVRGRFRDLFDLAISGGSIEDRGHLVPIRSKEGEREIEWYAAVMTNDQGAVIGLLCTGQDVTERRVLEREVLEIASDEQRRISHDLHDGICQELTGIGLLSQGIVSLLNDNLHEPSIKPNDLKRIRDAFQKLSSGIHAASAHARDLSHSMVPAEIDTHGLATALEELASRTDGLKAATCGFRCEGSTIVFGSFVATHLFRIAQEAVNNALKHSGAKNIQISMRQQASEIVLSIRDDGGGLSELSRARTGMGMQIMRYRADLIGATLSIYSDATGTVITCSCALETSI